MGRSIKKGPFVEEKLMKKVMKQKDTGDKEPIRTWSRSSTILPEFVSHTFLVHNGKSFNKVFVVEDLVGHKLGEFAPTRIFRGHTAKKKK
ncbi:MAG: 30S ribosomal protein S19 [Candidatus Scalindua sp.]|nr:30S ribosomal protein S19 [Candidatus Scalindua sp.]